MNYTDVSSIEKYLTIDIDTAFEPHVLLWIEAMSRHADKYCNRTLGTDIPEVRKFDGTGSQTLHIDDVVEIQSVVDVANATAITGYLTYPVNKPYAQSLLLEGGCFAKGKQNYTVDGYFAMHKDDVPEQISLAVTLMVAAIVTMSRSGGDNIKSEKVGIYSYVMKDLEQKNDYKIAMQNLDQFRKLAF